MDKLTDFDLHLKNAVNWLWEATPNIILAILIFFVGLWTMRMINRMVAKFFERKDYDVTLEVFLQSFIKTALKVILFVLIVTQLGVKSSSFIAILGSAGLAIGLALQGSLANFAGGILILVFKPFKVGDYISAQGLDGTVKEITLFTTKINTFGNQLAILPNGQLSNGAIVNYSAESTRRDKINVSIGYSSDIKKAKDILLAICNENENIKTEPKPEVYVGELGESSVNLTLRFWANNDVFWAAHFFVLEELKHRFDAESIEIPFPQRVVNTKTVG